MRLSLRRTMQLRLAVWCLGVLLFAVALYLRPRLFPQEEESLFAPSFLTLVGVFAVLSLATSAVVARRDAPPP